MSTKTQNAQIHNGVNIDQMVGTVNAIKGTPSLAKFNFRSSSKWGGGAKSSSYVKSFYGAGQETVRKEAFTFEGDEPQVLLGNDTAPNAVEALLSALTGCMTVSFIYAASPQGIKVHSLEYTIDGDVDLLGFLQLDPATKVGLQNIRVRANVRADASKEKIQELLDYATKTSVVMDTLRSGVPISVELA